MARKQISNVATQRAYGGTGYNVPAVKPKPKPRPAQVPSGVNRKDWLAQQAKIEERQGQVRGARILSKRFPRKTG